MAYTLSFDASLKLNKSQVKGVADHLFRDTINKDLNHSNEAIDPSLTCNNQTLYYNQKKRCFEKCTDVSQIHESLQFRLAKVKKPLRKDAVVARGLILQLDPQWYEDNGYDPEHTTNEDMVEWACKTFGAQNIVGLSVHEDETNPHIHILVCPVTDDGRLSQKDWFKNPASLREMHEDFRQHMRQKGYDISHERQPRRKHMSEADYKAFKEAEAKVAELREWEKDLKRRSNDLSKRESSLKAQEEAFEVKTQETTQELQKQLNEASNVLRECNKLHENLKFQSKSYTEAPISRIQEKKIVELDSKLSIDYDLEQQKRQQQQNFSFPKI